MRILYLTYFLKWGGLERQMAYLSKELTLKGHEVHIGFFHQGREGAETEMNNACLHSITKSSHYDPLVAWRLLRLIRSVNPDVVQTWHYLMDVYGGAACRLLHKPWILRDALPGMGDRRLIKRQLRRSLAGHADRIVTNSNAGIRYWRKHCPKASLQQINNGVPLEEIEQLSVSGPDLPIEMEQPFIIHVGQLIDRKNVAMLVEALGQVVKQIPIQTICCGDGPDRARLEQLAQEHGASEHIRFVGQLPKEQVWSLLKKARAFVSLSVREGCPNVVLEAMACQCPLVLSNIPEHRELVGEHARHLVDPQSIREIRDVIVEVWSNPREAQQQAERAKERSKSFSIDKMTQNYLQLYENVSRAAA